MGIIKNTDDKNIGDVLVYYKDLVRLKFIP